MEQAINTFENLVENSYPNDPDLHAFVKDLHEGILIRDENGNLPQPDPNVACFSGDPQSFGFIVYFVGPALFYWAVNELKARRNKQDLDAAKARIEYIQKLTDTGMPLHVAEGLVNSCLEAIAKRDREDAALTKLLAFAEQSLTKDALPPPKEE